MSVFLIEESNYLRQKLSQLIDLYELKINSTQGFLIKPNIVFPVSERSGQITRHKVASLLIRILREKHPEKKIIMAEGTAAGSDPEKNFRISGYSALAKKLHVPLIDLDKAERIALNWKYGTIKLPKLIFENFYINLPILKQSSAALISGAMKNQKGLLDPNIKKAFHKLDLHEPIAHLNKLIQPDLTILDGYNFFKHNLFIAGNNTLEVDITAARLLACDEPLYIKISKEIGVGNENFEVFWEGSRNNHPKFKPAITQSQKILRLRYWTNHRTCSMCRFLVKDIRRFAKGNLKYAFIMSSKMAIHAFTGLEIISGSKPNKSLCFKHVVCIGDCTRKFAKKNGYQHIPGCPPTKEQMIQNF